MRRQVRTVNTASPPSPPAAAARAWTALIVLVALVLLATSCTSHEPQSTAPSPSFGIAYGNRLVGMSDEDLAAALDDAVAVGARWVRADLAWGDIQPDGPDRHRWYVFDRVVRAASERSLSVLPVLAYTPKWARPAGCAGDNCAPADPEAFAAFVAKAATRYAPEGIHTWEIWNEPNIQDFWRPAPDATAYTTLLRTTSRALRQVDPSAYVILGGLAVANTRNGDISPADFLAAVAARGGNRLVDAVGYHPYTYPQLASAPSSSATAWQGIDASQDSLHGILSAHGTPDLPVWITEFGAPTNGPGRASDGRRGATGATTTHVTEKQQAAIAADAVPMAARTPRVRALIWYTDRDQSTDTSSRENFFGLRRADGSAKPAFEALRGAIAAHGDRP
ncbi:cellulase family glycosylhydrolase [Streptomyces sp. NBC_00287]|uniref:cellulase family glycosylhydrolase n=1 Tax=Streptomyces sp. NBC_00287 TaxID=2975702 RepID=UPI002E2CD364|nr:cellulase family glycosylhydrolase [Streptomyces sp. NBC_00287]